MRANIGQHWRRVVQGRKLSEISFRIPKPVTAYKDLGDGTAYWVCPQCGLTLDRDFQAYCDRCGQCLDWSLTEIE